MPGYAADKGKVLTRLRRIEGQVRGLQRMVEEDQYCIDAITSEVTGVPGVGGVSVDLDAGTVTVTGEEVDDMAVRAAVDEAGYQIVG